MVADCSTVKVVVAAALVVVPSLTTTEILRVAMVGDDALSLYVMLCSTVWYVAMSSTPLIVRTPSAYAEVRDVPDVTACNCSELPSERF